MNRSEPPFFSPARTGDGNERSLRYGDIKLSRSCATAAGLGVGIVYADPLRASRVPGYRCCGIGRGSSGGNRAAR